MLNSYLLLASTKMKRNLKENLTFSNKCVSRDRDNTNEYVIRNSDNSNNSVSDNDETDLNRINVEHSYAKRIRRIVIDDEPGCSNSLEEVPSKSSQRKQRQLDLESEEHRAKRLEKQRDYARRKRHLESEEVRNIRISEMRNRNALARANETVQEREIRLEQDRERHVNVRATRNLENPNRIRANGYVVYECKNTELYRLSPLDVPCTHCGALHFKEEKVSNRGSSFNDCCHHGKVNIEAIPEQEFPEALKNLFLRRDHRYRNFFECIRELNSSVSMASMNPLRFRYPSNRGPYCFRIFGQIYHKMNVALHPDQGDAPAYGQMFIVDTALAINALRQANPRVEQSLLADVFDLIKGINPYAEAYVMMKEEEEAELERARHENRDPVEIKLLFSRNKDLDRRRGYNIPRANEVAAVYVPGADGEVPDAKIVVRERGKELRILNSVDKNVTPMTYPLFYPRGTFGWHPGIRQKDPRP